MTTTRDRMHMVKERLRWIPIDRAQRTLYELALEDRKGHVPITGCDVETVLEAAHVDRHIEHGDNSPANGILLRSGIHALFDVDLFRIRPYTLMLHLDKCVAASAYAEYVGRRLQGSVDGRQPNRTGLAARRGRT